MGAVVMASEAMTSEDGSQSSQRRFCTESPFWGTIMYIFVVVAAVASMVVIVLSIDTDSDTESIDKDTDIDTDSDDQNLTDIIPLHGSSVMMMIWTQLKWLVPIQLIIVLVGILSFIGGIVCGITIYDFCTLYQRNKYNLVHLNGNSPYWRSDKE